MDRDADLVICDPFDGADTDPYDVLNNLDDEDVSVNENDDNNASDISFKRAASQLYARIQNRLYDL